MGAYNRSSYRRKNARFVIGAHDNSGGRRIKGGKI